jgi:hypothetical protein
VYVSAENTVCPMHFLLTLVQKQMTSSQLPFNYSLECTSIKIQENQELNGTHQLVTCKDGVNLLDRNIIYMKKSRNSIIS